jgi:hypothetical protein
MFLIKVFLAIIICFHAIIVDTIGLPEELLDVLLFLIYNNALINRIIWGKGINLSIVFGILLYYFIRIMIYHFYIIIPIIILIYLVLE